MNNFWTYWCINAFTICNFMWCIHLHAIYPSVRMHVYMYHLVTKQVCCLIGTKFINTRLNVAVIGTNCLLHEVSLPPSSKNFCVCVCFCLWFDMIISKSCYSRIQYVLQGDMLFTFIFPSLLVLSCTSNFFIRSLLREKQTHYM